MSAEELPARETMEFDVVIVGAGPAGLAAAIRLKEISPDTTVVVVEKGSEVGAHILSGAVIDPIGLDRLIPDWRSEDSPVKTQVSDDRFYWLLATRAVRLPNVMLPPLMNNHGNYVVSLGNVCRWLATKAEAAGVEIYPRFAAAEVLFDGSGAVAEAATGDMASPRMATTRIASPAAWSCARNTRCSPRARAAASPRRSCNASAWPKAANRRNSVSASRSYGRSRRKNIVPAWCSTRSAGRSTTAPAAAPFSIISTTGSFPWASWCISTTKIRISRRMRNSSASRPIRWCAQHSRAASGSLMARAR